MLFLLSTALAIASAFLPQSNALMVCNGTVGGKFYDLSPLHALGDTKITPMSGAYDYYVNVCGSVGGPCANRSAFACQVRKSPADQFESVVAYSDVESHSPAPAWGPSASETGGVKLVFTNGDSCNLRQRVMNIDFQCDENGTRAITIDENPQCMFNIVYPTKVVCAAPTTEAPTTKAPTTEAPTTKAPTTEAPTTKAPTTEAPTHAPTTEAPTHAPNGTTTVPTTEAPTHAPNGTTTVPTTYAPTVLPTTQAPTTAAPTTHAPTSTPSASSSTTYDENSITRAGVGVGIGVGIGILALVWLLWCCYDRSRTQRVQVDSGYATLTSSSV